MRFNGALLESTIFKFESARNFCRPRYIEIRSYLQYTNKEKYGQFFFICQKL